MCVTQTHPCSSTSWILLFFPLTGSSWTTTLLGWAGLNSSCIRNIHQTPSRNRSISLHNTLSSTSHKVNLVTHLPFHVRGETESQLFQGQKYMRNNFTPMWCHITHNYTFSCDVTWQLHILMWCHMTHNYTYCVLMSEANAASLCSNVHYSHRHTDCQFVL